LFSFIFLAGLAFVDELKLPGGENYAYQQPFAGHRLYICFGFWSMTCQPRKESPNK
jgi:hypothetical protein